MLDRQTLKSALVAKPDCLSLEQLEGLAADPAGSHPHLAQCPRCQAELALLKSFESSEPLPGEGAAVAWISSHLERNLEQIKNPSSARARRTDDQRSVSWLARMFGSWQMRVYVPVAAALAIAIASVVLLRPAKEPDLRADAGSGPAVFRSQEVELVGASGELAQPPTTFEWNAFAGAASYKVAVMEVDQTALWSFETKETKVEVPGSLRAKMLPGKPLLWQVTAQDLQGRILATSQSQRFVVARKPLGSND